MYSADKLGTSNFVEGFNQAFILILAFSIIFIAVLTFLIIYFIIRYNNKKHPRAVQNEGNKTLEILWTAGAVVLVLVLFHFGWAGYKPMLRIPDDALRIKAIARQWQFQFVYENGKTMDTLIVPVDKPVVLDLVSLDVIHSLYIPSFRIKQDMVPGLSKDMWFKAQREGKYDLFCAEYCGLDHAYMNTAVKVLSGDAYNEWYVDTTAKPVVDQNLPLWRVGLQVTQTLGCNACHSTDGSVIVGPSHLGVWGSTVNVVTAGKEREVVADSLYIRRSILEPNADVVEGYQRGLMLSYDGLVTEEQIGQIIAYFKHLAQ